MCYTCALLPRGDYDRAKFVTSEEREFFTPSTSFEKLNIQEGN